MNIFAKHYDNSGSLRGKIDLDLFLDSPERNWVFATNSHFLTPISLQPDDVNLWYFKLKLFDFTE